MKKANQKIEEGLIENKNVTPLEQTEERIKRIRGQTPVETMQNPSKGPSKKREKATKARRSQRRSRPLLAKIEDLAMTS